MLPFNYLRLDIECVFVTPLRTNDYYGKLINRHPYEKYINLSPSFFCTFVFRSRFSIVLTYHKHTIRDIEFFYGIVGSLKNLDRNDGEIRAYGNSIYREGMKFELQRVDRVSGYCTICLCVIRGCLSHETRTA